MRLNPNLMKKWNPRIKPPKHVCPKHYCFFFAGVDSEFAEGLYDNVAAAWKHLQLVTEDSCTCGFLGICIRQDPINGNNDWYEPCEPELSKARLPWFYFMSKPPAATDPADSPQEARQRYKQYKKYLKQSRLLWGKDH